MPPVCAVTGAPATEQLPVLFRNRTALWLPAVGRLVMSMTSPPVLVKLPLSSEAKKKITTWRLIGLVGALVGVILAIVFAVAVGDLAGSLLCFLSFGGVVAVLVVSRMQADSVGSDVNGDVISMSKAHPAFVQALAESNHPGMIAVDGTAQPQSGHPQNQYAQPTQYAQPSQYAQPNQVQAGQPAYEQAPYGQAQYGQGQYGQGQYGQAPYGQSQYGPGQYGQAQYGPGQYGQAPYGQAPQGYPQSGQPQPHR